jgi:hypothetical protein
LDPEFDIHLDVGDPGDMIEMLATPNIKELASSQDSVVHLPTISTTTREKCKI